MSRRDSGIWWVGNIPSHWSVEPVRSRFAVQLGKMVNAATSTGPNERPYLRNVNIQWDRVQLGQLPVMRFSEAECRRLELRPGDLLVCEGGEVGRTAIWRGEAQGCLYQKAVHRLRPRAEVDGRFFYYCMLAAAGMGVFTAEGNQSTIVHLTAEKLRAHRFAFPPLREQQRLAALLDRETERVDELISKKSQMMELLVERRSSAMFAGVSGALTSRQQSVSSLPWLESRGRAWSEPKLSLIARLGSGHTPSRDHPEWWLDCTVPWITTGEVAQMRNDRIEYITATREQLSPLGVANSAAEVHPIGTVVLCRTAASAGYSAVMGSDMATSQDFATWTCGPLLRPRFLLLCLRVMRQDLLGRLAMGSTHKTIYMPDIESIRIPLPTVEEQDRIIDDVWRRLGPLDTASDAIVHQIDLLRERRIALVISAITGDVEVPGEAA